MERRYVNSVNYEKHLFCKLLFFGIYAIAFSSITCRENKFPFSCSNLKNIRQQCCFCQTTSISTSPTDFMADFVFNSQFNENISEDEKIAGLSLLWAEVKYNFVFFDKVPNLNWNRLYFDYLTRVRQSRSTLEYYLLLQELCAQLKDSHTNVSPPEILFKQLYARPAIRTRMIEDRVLIVAVWDEGLRRDGLNVGLEIVSIDGLSVREYAKQYVTPYQSSSTVQDLITHTYEYSLLTGKEGVPVTLELNDSSGNIFTKVLQRVFQNVPKRPPLEFKMLGENIAYVALNTFSTKKVTEMFDSLYKKIQSADALIIDVRNNDGGNGNFGYDILGYLLDRPFKISNWKTRKYLPSFRAWGHEESWYTETNNMYTPKNRKYYAKPVVVLTSSRTVSAAEDFCVAFDYAKRGIIIGEKTAGSTGQPLSIALPGGGSARICTKHDTCPDGKEFVGIGIHPSIEVYPTVEDVRAGRDTVLETALAYLRKKLDVGIR